jgi:hypothetical protein
VPEILHGPKTLMDVVLFEHRDMGSRRNSRGRMLIDHVRHPLETAEFPIDGPLAVRSAWRFGDVRLNAVGRNLSSPHLLKKLAELQKVVIEEAPGFSLFMS